MITITVNGKRDTVGPGTSISGYLAFKNSDPSVAVVEVNKSIVKKKDFGNTILNDGDIVEILRFVGGG
jgi:sulfur carrier protein